MIVHVKLSNEKHVLEPCFLLVLLEHVGIVWDARKPSKEWRRLLAIKRPWTTLMIIEDLVGNNLLYISSNSKL